MNEVKKVESLFKRGAIESIRQIIAQKKFPGTFTILIAHWRIFDICYTHRPLENIWVIIATLSPRLGARECMKKRSGEGLGSCSVWGPNRHKQLLCICANGFVLPGISKEQTLNARRAPCCMQTHPINRYCSCSSVNVLNLYVRDMRVWERYWQRVGMQSDTGGARSARKEMEEWEGLCPC